MGNVVRLSKGYVSIYGKPIIDRVDVEIFHVNYSANCMEQNCRDICCMHGVDIDIENINRLRLYKDDLEKISGVKFEQMFDGEYIDDDEFPGGKRTRTSKNSRGCIFLSEKSRGCTIHSFCISKNIEYHKLKPIVSCLFPITFDKGLLHTSNEILESSLTCCNNGICIYDGVKAELKYYFGEDFINELDKIKRQSIQGQGGQA